MVILPLQYFSLLMDGCYVNESRIHTALQLDILRWDWVEGEYVFTVSVCWFVCLIASRSTQKALKPIAGGMMLRLWILLHFGVDSVKREDSGIYFSTLPNT